mmetsp:Transcript_9558/g.34827  ORF Transcript_9558/g.34827 Transcript_9558/m.34827 type:complete len:239 (+) Transcript_9558:816-1532(+)
MHRPRPFQPGKGSAFDLGHELGLNPALKHRERAVFPVPARRDEFGPLDRVPAHARARADGQVDHRGYPEHGVSDREGVPGVVRRAVRGGGGAERRGGDAADAVDFSVRVDLPPVVAAAAAALGRLPGAAVDALAVEHRLELVVLVHRRRRRKRRRRRRLGVRFSFFRLSALGRRKHRRVFRRFLLLQRHEQRVPDAAAQEQQPSRDEAHPRREHGAAGAFQVHPPARRESSAFDSQRE